jgi:uncharacterized integral membrane protein
MRLLSFITRIALFLLVLVFALANTQLVKLTLVPGIEGLMFEAPMVVWLLGSFALGIAACFLFLLPTLVAAWRRSN